MKLTELEPGWFSSGDGRHGMGIGFNCPHCVLTAAETDTAALNPRHDFLVKCCSFL